MRTLRFTSALAALLTLWAIGAPRAELRAAPYLHAPRARTIDDAGARSPERARGADLAAQTAGSANTVTADPRVPRPSEAPCVVTLFRGLQFADFSAKPFAYAPPAACPGPWDKVVLVGDFTVSAGRQYDRTAQISVGNVNLYFGTTPEPSRYVAPAWHFERELTDESALLQAAHPGEADLGNLVDATYTGVITGSAYIQFYPAFGTQHARRPDVVLPVPDLPGGAQALASGTSTLTQTYVLPANVERAYLDVFAQSQSSDEFWYACVTNDLAAALFTCGNTAFRETQIAIDGRPAGVAPVYPWIYTGGIDPYLWRPIPGVQALNFKPYRVDLTPFAGLLDDGHAHSVSLAVSGANSYFQATSTLLLYLDHGTKHVSGALTRDSLAAPSPSVLENVATTGGYPNGTLSVTSAHAYRIEGFVRTSHGTVTTVLDGDVRFANQQRIKNSAVVSDQDIVQDTLVQARATRRGPDGVEREAEFYHYPLVAKIDAAISPTQYAQTTTIHQGYEHAHFEAGPRAEPESAYVGNDVSASDTLVFALPTFALLSHAGQASSQRYVGLASNGPCYERSIFARDDVLVGTRDGCRDTSRTFGALQALVEKSGAAR